jgi:hypothetical protein
MAFSFTKFIKGLLISEEGTITPKEILVQPGGSSGTRTTLTSSQTTDRTLTLPDATDTVVARNTTEVLTNKTVVVASNTVTTAASGNLTSTELNAALSELQGDIDTRALDSDLQAHINDTTDAHDAAAISNVPSGNLAATDVQSALNELQTDIDSRATSTDLTNHINDTSDAHDASAISNVPSGNLVATDVQAALNELQSDVDARATTTLNNLGTTSINSNLLPNADSARNLGSSSLKYLETHTSYVKGSAIGDLQLDAGRVLINAAQTNLADPSSTDPVSDLIAGNVYFNNVANKYRYYNGTSWQDLTPSALINPMDSDGDLIVGGASGVPIKLDAGTTSQILRGGTSPSFGNVPVAALGSQGNITTFTSSGTFTTPTNSSASTIYKYTVVGGGGGAGGANGSTAVTGGGGAGSYLVGTFNGVAASTGITITIGAGGTAGSSAGGNGGNGGTSSIGSPVNAVCNGGGGSPGSTSAAGTTGGPEGAGSIAVSGPNISINIPGRAGGRGWWQGAGGIGQAGQGSDTCIGSGGVGGSSNVAQAPSTATGYGAGGGGALLLTTAGEPGMPGIVIIEQLTP